MAEPVESLENHLLIVQINELDEDSRKSVADAEPIASLANHSLIVQIDELDKGWRRSVADVEPIELH